MRAILARSPEKEEDLQQLHKPDCIYLALAQRMGRILVTADGRFLKSLSSTRHAPWAVALGAVIV
jgi:predicted nucleic acid-binding protein